jgi:hypothetical protein
LEAAAGTAVDWVDFAVFTRGFDALVPVLAVGFTDGTAVLAEGVGLEDFAGF